MEKLAKKIAEMAGKSGNYDEEKVAVIAYGLTSLFQMIIIFIVCSAVGLFFGFWPEVVILFFSVGLLRSATGGAHSQTFGGCMVISIGMICLLAFLAHTAGAFLTEELSKIIFPFIFALGFLVAYIKAPVDNPRKRITKQDKITRLRNRAFLLLSIYTAASLLLIFFGFYSLTTSFALGTIWQIFTLTPPCAAMIGSVDKLFLLAVSDK